MMFHNIGLGNDFMAIIPKAQAITTKTVKLHQTKKLLYSKGCNQQSEKATYRLKENICISYV